MSRNPFGQTGDSIFLTFLFALRLQRDCLQAERLSLEFLLVERLSLECASLECLVTEPGQGLVKSGLGLIQRFQNCFDPEKMTFDTRPAGVETELEMLQGCSRMAFL